MATANGLPSEFSVRQMTLDDIPAVIDLQLRAFPGLPPWRPDQLERHLEIFPEGQLVVSDPAGDILGSASSLIIDWDDYAEVRQLVGDHRGWLVRYPQPARQDPLWRRHGRGP